MASSPSHRWEGGVLVERALSTIVPGEPAESDDVSGTRPYKTPVPTKRGATTKALSAEAAENKAVKRASKK